MSVDLAFDDGQQAIADAVSAWCADHCSDEVVKAATGTLPRTLWRGLAAQGVLGILTPEGDGGALEMVAALESLGRAVFPGPLAATFLATAVLDEPLRARLVAGEALASVGTPPLLPFAAEADVFLEIAESENGEERLHLARLADAAPRVVDTLGGEPWARVRLERMASLPHGAAGLVVYRTAIAAQLAALGERLVAEASRHAAVRRQFGRAIGEFQAVAHPLADCSMRLAAAATLARAAAFHLDHAGAAPDGLADARRFAAAAHLSACEAALAAAHVCHQVFGAIGITLEGPAFHVSRRIRQLASQAPDRAASRRILFVDLDARSRATISIGAGGAGAAGAGGAAWPA